MTEVKKRLEDVPKRLYFLPYKKMTEVKKRLEDVPKRPRCAMVPKGLSVS